MTREEKLQQFAEQNTKGLHLDRHNLIQMVKQGAEWADQHPQWIPVEERLPEDDECCLIYGDCGIDIGSYNSKTQYWLSEYSGQPTHWMPLPEPPKKGGEQ